MKTPRKPEGSGNSTAFFQWVWERLARELRFMDSPTVKWSRTTSGISAQAISSAKGGGELKTYRVKSKIGDVLFCVTWDGENEGDSDHPIPIAVNRNSRQLASETINGITYTYSAYTDVGDSINETRNSNNGTTDETQIVTPMWYEDCEIDVIATNYSGVDHDDHVQDPYDLKLIEVSARCWAKVTEP